MESKTLFAAARETSEKKDREKNNGKEIKKDGVAGYGARGIPEPDAGYALWRGGR